MKCLKCEKIYDDEFDYCPFCGFKRPSPQICPKCKSLYDEFNFCPKCGIELVDLEIFKKIGIGDVVVLISGPFKDYKGKVIREDKICDEIVVELIETEVPIPLTVPYENVRKE